MPKKLKVLVIDDSEEFCQNIKDILEMRDYAAAIAYDGYKTIELVKGNGFDLVLIVDDDKDLCSNGKDTLSERGYRVAVAYDAETAIQKIWERSESLDRGSNQEGQPLILPLWNI